MNEPSLRRSITGSTAFCLARQHKSAPLAANAENSSYEPPKPRSASTSIPGVHDPARERASVFSPVEYGIDDPGRPQAEASTYRLVTTLLDPGEAPAAELAGCYAQRWEIESVFDEMKSHQRGPAVVLRSKTPDGVRQEAWGYLCCHYAIRALIASAASDRGVGPDRISFTRTLHAARRSTRSGLGTGTETLTIAIPATLAEICRELVPDRPLRAAARVVKKKMSNYGLKHAAHRNWPQPTRRPAAAIRIITAL